MTGLFDTTTFRRLVPSDVPEIVCLCGSTRFVETFNEWRKRLTYEGKIVLSIEIVTIQAADEDPQHVNPERKAMLDELHLRKIDLADRVLVLNVGGYIGDSTRREIEYALRERKRIDYLEPSWAPKLDLQSVQPRIPVNVHDDNFPSSDHAGLTGYPEEIG